MTCSLHSAFHKNFHVFWAGRSDKEGTLAQTERQADRHIEDRQTDGHTEDRQTDIQAEKHTKERHGHRQTDRDKHGETNKDMQAD
jgi:hypothetical protein